MNPIGFRKRSETVWERLLEQVEDFQDRLAIVMSYPELEETYKVKKQEWMFPAVIPILISNFENDEGTSKMDKTLKTSILNCRLVSSLTCKAIDNYGDSFWKKYLGPPTFWPERTLNFLDGKNVLLFLEQMRTHPDERPSIINRNICLDVPFMRTRNEQEKVQKLSPKYAEKFEGPYPLENDTLELLDKVGKHISGVSICVTSKVPGYIDLDRSRESVQKILSRIPKLRSLTFAWMHQYLYALPPEEVDKGFPMPKMPFLEDLCLLISEPIAMKTVNFEQFFPQLVRLSIGVYVWKEEYNNAKGLFPKLRWLELRAGDWYTHLPKTMKGILKIFGKLNAPKLEELCLEIHGKKEAPCKVKMLVPSIKIPGLTILRKKYSDSKWSFKKSFKHGRYYNFRFIRMGKVKRSDLVQAEHSNEGKGECQQSTVK